MLRALSSTKLKSARSVVTEATAFAPESRRVHDEVGAAALRYEESRAQLRLLIAALREQHSLVLRTSEKRLETAKRFEKFLAGTPLSEMVSEAGTAEAGEKIFARSGPGPAPATTSAEERRREPAEKPSSPSPASPERAEGAPDGGGSNSAEEGDEYERLISSRSSSDSAASETPEEGDAEAGKRELGSPDDAHEVDPIGGGVSGNQVVASEDDDAAEEEAKEEEADEGLEPKAKPKKPPESDEEMAMRLAKEWADEAEGWAGPSLSEKEGEKEDGELLIPACPTDVSDSTRSRSSEGSSTSPAAEIEPRAERTRERAEKEEDARRPRREPPPPFQSLVFAGGDFDAVHHRSYGAVHEAAHKLTVLYSDRYVADVLNYVEEWDGVVSSRVRGRIMEFERMGRNLEHYVRKVDGLRTDIKKRESRNRRVSPRSSRRFDRNELKLGGAREAYDSYGEGTLLLLEEVADRAWRDCLPLLTRVVRYDANFGADSAEVLSALKETAGTLEELGEARGVDPDGRLGALRDSRPEEVYTGGKYVVPPVRSARDVFEV